MLRAALLPSPSSLTLPSVLLLPFFLSVTAPVELLSTFTSVPFFSFFEHVFIPYAVTVS